MAKPKKTSPTPTQAPAPLPNDDDPRSPRDLLIAYRWHRGEEVMAVEVYRASFGENPPSIADAMVKCGEIAEMGPPPADYRPPGADPEPTPLEQVVHPPDPTYAPTEPREPIETPTVPTPSRYAVLGTETTEHEFSLTPEDRTGVGLKAAEQEALIRRLREEHAAARRLMREEATAAAGELTRLLHVFETGKEARKVQVTRRADYVNGTVTHLLPDGSPLKVTPLADDDRQLALFREQERAGTVVEGLLASLPPESPEDESNDTDTDDGDGDEW